MIPNTESIKQLESLEETPSDEIIKTSTNLTIGSKPRSIKLLQRFSNPIQVAGTFRKVIGILTTSGILLTLLYWFAIHSITSEHEATTSIEMSRKLTQIIKSLYRLFLFAYNLPITSSLESSSSDSSIAGDMLLLNEIGNQIPNLLENFHFRFNSTINNEPIIDNLKFAN